MTANGRRIPDTNAKWTDAGYDDLLSGRRTSVEAGVSVVGNGGNMVGVSSCMKVVEGNSIELRLSTWQLGNHCGNDANTLAE